MIQKSTEIETYIGVDSSFSDFTRFEDDAAKRKVSKSNFIADDVYVPNYEYPKLDTFNDVDDKGKFIKDKKHDVYEAVLELEAHKESGLLSPDEFELYAAFHENRLKKIMLVESARRMRYADSSSKQQTARSEFMALNEEIYGSMDVATFEGMMHTEQERVASFVPKDERSRSIKQYVDTYFSGHSFESIEPPLLDTEILTKLRSTLMERYDAVLQVVPKTSDDVIYDAAQCRDIMQAALEAGGLAADGWTVEVSPSKSNPTTNGEKKTIYLPSDTARNAEQISRLIVHEQEVHARRSQNGENAGIKALKSGTAEYADVEEGLGVLFECAISGDQYNQSYYRARDRYVTAGLALGVDGIPKDGRQTYEIVWRLMAVRDAVDGVITMSDEKAAKSKTMIHIDNAFRGTNFAMPGVIYTKLKVYYEGLAKNAAFINENTDDIEHALDQAMLGKYNHTDPVETELVKSVIDSHSNQQ